jgi:hypothetical protein
VQPRAAGQIAVLSATQSSGACHQDAAWWADLGLPVHQAWDERHPRRARRGRWQFNEKAARKAATMAAGEVVKGVDPNDAKREAKRQQLAEKQATTLATLIIEDGPYETSLTGRQVVNWKPAMSALRRGLKDHFDLAIAELTRRQIMAAVDKIAKTGKRGAAKDLRKHVHTFLEWCVGEGYVEHNVLVGYGAPKETRAQRVGRRTKGRALTDEEIIKVWHASGKLGAFGQLARMCLLGGPRRTRHHDQWQASWMTASPSMRHGPRWACTTTCRAPTSLTRCSRQRNISSARHPTMSSRHRRPVARCRASPRWSTAWSRKQMSPSSPCMI